MTQTTYTLNDLSIGYRAQGTDKVLARHLNARLPEGRLTCLLARNGAGKSTLLRTMAGFIPSLDGQVVLADKPLSSYSPKEIAKTIGVVLTDKIHCGNLTAFELVAMGRLPYSGFLGGLTAADRDIVKEAIEMVGMSSFVKRKISELSDGELQKLVIAKTLAQQTAVVLLDEPLAFLDFNSKISMMQLLRHLAHDCNKTVLLSIHDLEIALQAADNLWVLTPEGSLEQGVPSELSLSGSLDFFFKDESVSFDRSTMQYSFNNNIEES